MIYDLSLPINERTPIYPGDPKPSFEKFAKIDKDGFNIMQFSFNTHFSTHIDFPLHMIKDGKSLSDYPIDKFVGECIVLDARNQDINNTDLDKARKGDFVFFCTGHIKKAYSKDFFGSGPTISKEFAKKLVKKKVNIVGLDSYGPDEEPYEVHKILLKENILIVENLVNLDLLVGRRFRCYIAPLKLENSDGAPCRVIALID